MEAGPDYGYSSEGHWPADLLDPTRFPTSHDWGFSEQRGDDALPEPRARVLGGCSTHNQCAAVWAPPDDYDRWAELTAETSWCYDALRPLIDEIQDARGGGDVRCRGRGGLLPTRPWSDGELGRWQQAFLSAAREAGFPRLPDLCAPEPTDGACAFEVNVHGGWRWNAAFAFLDPVRERSTLYVLADTLADRLLFDGARAEALICRSGKETRELRARAFVLAAGVYGSPAILLRSGIGPAGDLERLGIARVTALPGVGRNLHDHPGVALRFEPTEAALRELDEDLTSGRFHQSQAVLRAADHRLHVLPYHARLEGGWSFHLIAFAMRPASRGTVSLRSTDPADAPAIDFRFLSDAAGHDLTTLREGVELIRRLAATEPLARRGRLAATTELDANADAYIRANITGYAHAVGTCRMGSANDADTVTDASGLVRATTNVHVADASLIPIIPAANTNLTAMLIGWRTADAVAASARE